MNDLLSSLVVVNDDMSVTIISCRDGVLTTLTWKGNKHD